MGVKGYQSITPREKNITLAVGLLPHCKGYMFVCDKGLAREILIVPPLG